MGLDGVELIMTIEEEFKFTISQVKTLDCRVWSRKEVFEKVRDISVEVLDVKPEQVKLESHWINDLGVG